MQGDDGIIIKERTPRLIAEHRIAALVLFAGIIGFFFTVIGLILYNSSGSAQVDLSRPGYASSSLKQNNQEEKQRDFSASGPVNQEMFQEFDSLYSIQVDNAHEIDAFSGDPMALDALGIDSNTSGVSVNGE